MPAQIFHFRVLLDHPEEVFRDIHIEADASFQELHDTILDSFGFSGLEMASFYLSNDEWDKGEEITLMDMGNGQGNVLTMQNTLLKDMVSEEGDKLLYLYDFMRMWIWYIELINPSAPEKFDSYPAVVLTVGTPPAEDSKEWQGTMPIDFDPDLEGFDEFGDEDDFEDIDDYEAFR
jgi:hypothetical protein